MGPRGTGKSKLIEMQLGESAKVIDLLSEDYYGRLIRRPSLLGEIISSDQKLVVIDEVQRIPALLNEVHRLIEKRGVTFLLTGSSARKLKRSDANLLGGRAWEANLYPLTSFELGSQFDLIKYCNYGGLPSIYFSKYPNDELKAYGSLYIQEEIQIESAVRKLDSFMRFLDILALTNGKEINISSIANDAGVPPRTVSSFMEVISDTLLGFYLVPFSKTKIRKSVSRSKFYFFDVGVARALAKQGEIVEDGANFGDAFEHFIVQEVRAFVSYLNKDYQLSFWRSSDKDEVDLIVGNKIAIEIKSTRNVDRGDLKGLRRLQEEKLIEKYIIVSRDPIRRHIGEIECIPYVEFLEGLWGNKII